MDDGAILCRECMTRGSKALLWRIREAGPPLPAARVSVRELAIQAAMIGGVTQAEIEGRGRSRALVDLRRAVGFIAREATDLSYPVIGQWLGGRDHSTIINLRRTAEVRVDRDPAFALLVERVWSAAECAPRGPAECAPQRQRRPIRSPRLRPQPASAARVVTVKAEPGEYRPRHELPPVLAVVDCPQAGEPCDDDGDLRRHMVLGSVALIEALRREFPERFAGWAS